MSSFAQTSSSSQPAPGGGGVTTSTPTLVLYPVFAALHKTLRPFLDLSEPLPTDPQIRESLGLQIICRIDALSAAASDLRVGANKDLLAFCRGLSYILSQLQPDTVDKFKFTWSWLVPVSAPVAFTGFNHDKHGNPTPQLAVTLPPPPPPPMPVPVPLPSFLTKPKPSPKRTVPKRTSKTPRAPSFGEPILPPQLEGLYRIPTPASDCSDSSPFGVVPGWVPQLPSYLLENWSRELSDQQRKDLPEPQPEDLRDPDYEEKKAPASTTKGTKGKAKAVPRPLIWLHESKEPLPSDLPGQEASFDDWGTELPCPNDFREYLLPDEKRTFSIAHRPQSILAPTHLLPPFGLKPRSDTKRKHKSDAHPKVTPPQKLPVYGRGPLFKQGKLLSELAAPLPSGPSPPQWVRPPCGSCAAQGFLCTGGDFLHGVCCDNCNVLKQPCGFDIAIPRLTSLSALASAADASPERISSLIVDTLMLRGMTQVAFALAEDQYKLLESKVGTLSLILRRVYSAEGDSGLRRYFTDIDQLKELLEFSRSVSLDTPMLYPRRMSTTAMTVDNSAYEWTTTFDQSEVDEYLTNLRNSLREPASPPQEMEVDELVASEHESDHPPPPLPSRPPPAVSFQQIREPTPLFPKKRGRDEVSSDSEAASEAESVVKAEADESSSESDSSPSPSPKAGPSNLKPIFAPVVKTYAKYDANPLIKAAAAKKTTSKDQRKWEKIQSQAKKQRNL